MPALPLLPPKDHPAYRLTLALLAVMPFVFGLLALHLGQDANWDLRNYHWYNAYAFLNGRDATDLLPSQHPFFYNPLLDVPFYVLAQHVTPKTAFFILGTVQGLNYILLFLLAHAVLVIPGPGRKAAACALLALLGMLGGMGIAEIGTVFYDNVTSLGLLLSALLLIRNLGGMSNDPPRRAAVLAFLCALPAGLMAGLKLTTAPFCLGLGISFLLAGLPWRRCLLAGFFFGCGILAGLALTYGHWAFFLQTHFANPFFPFFNVIFKSPYAPLSIVKDTTFEIPGNWAGRLLFPLMFTKNVRLVNEIDWRDWRIAILYFLLIAACLSPWRRKGEGFTDRTAGRCLLAVFAATYAAWVFMFCVYRYVLALEMLAPLLIVLALDMFPLRKRALAWFSASLLLVVACSVRPGDWGRRAEWSQHIAEITRPAVPDSKNVMLLMAGHEGFAHIVTQFPPQVPVVRIESRAFRLKNNWGMNDLIAKRIGAHRGSFMVLLSKPEDPDYKKTREQLAYFHLSLAQKSCRKVEDLVYEPHVYALCTVKKTSP